MQEASTDPRVPGPNQGNLGRSEGLNTSHLNNGVFEKFAQNMTKNIIQWFLGQMEMVEPNVVSRFNGNQEMLAEELASAVVEEALRDASRGQKWVKSLRSAEEDMECGRAKSSDEFESDLLEINPNAASEDIQPCNPALSQSGLPVLGSIDYPDAPPTTPLHPQPERSRYSFTKKLKGGLAKVFLPSPPPPTPKEEEDGANNDPRVELMEHLMHSLSMDDLATEYSEVGGQVDAKMEAFAEALSYDIIDSILCSKNRDLFADDSDIHQLAHELAESIIISSIYEAKMIV